MEKNILWREDAELFSAMESNCQSDNERHFFTTMKRKQQYEPSLSNDLILHEDDNSDGVAIIRSYYDEYTVAVANGKEWKQKHVMNLSQALSINLMALGLSRDMTLGQWLKQNDYAHIQYNHNYDDI